VVGKPSPKFGLPQQSATPPAYKGRGAGIATIGDSLLRGFMAGHAQKEQRKYAQAQAGLNVAQMTEQTAWQNYQDALTQNGGKENETTQGLYANYKDAVNRNTDLMKKYAEPEKKSKKSGQSGSTTSGKTKGKDDTQKPQSFGEKVKNFFEANPTLVPKMAVLAREAAGVKPPGLSREGQVQNLDYQAKTLAVNSAKREEAQADQLISDQNVIAAANAAEKDMSPEQKKIARAAMKPEDRKKLEEAEARRDERINEARGKKGKENYWTNGTDTIALADGEVPPPGSGYHLVNERQQTAPKGEEAFVSEYVKKNGLDAANLDPATRVYLHDYWQYKNPQTTSTASETTVDEHGKRITSTGSTRGSKAPAPPPGVAAVEEAAPQGGAPKGGMTPPPKSAAPQAKTSGGIMARPGSTSKAAAPKAASGPMTATPGQVAGGKKTLTDANREESREKVHETSTAAAYKEYSDKIAANGAKYGGDPASLQAANKAVADAYYAKIWQNEKNFHRGEKMTQAKDAKGVIYGSFDGKNFFNVATGQPYQGQ